MQQKAPMIPGGEAADARRHGSQGLRLRNGVRLVALTLVLMVVMGATSAARAQEVLLSVAVSLKDATEELGREFKRAHPGVTLLYNFGASGDLQKQIEAGAPVDLFISAGQRQVDELEKLGLLLPGSRRVFARNALTLIVPHDSKLDLRNPAELLRPEVHRVVIGNPRTVPAGQYAEESLRTLALWDTLRPKLVFAENVRQALEYVARVAHILGFRNILRGIVLEATVARLRIGWRGQTLEALNSPTFPYLPPAGSPVAFFIRPEDVRLLRKDGSPPDPAHHTSILSGSVVGNSDAGVTRILRMRLDEPGQPAQGEYDLEIEVPRFVYEALQIDHHRHWDFSIHRGSIYVLPGSLAVGASETDAPRALFSPSSNQPG